MVEVATQVYVTHDYDLFSFSEDNRKVNAKDHAALAASIERYGNRQEFPIVVLSPVDGRYPIFEGQHRFVEAKRRGEPIYFIIAGPDFEMDVAELNCTSVNWKMPDFVRRWHDAGLPAYAELVSFAKEYDLDLSAAASLLCGVTTNARVRSALRRGEFVVTNREFAHRVAEFYREIVNKEPGLKGGRFLNACIAAFSLPEFDPERFKRGARLGGHLLRKCGLRDDVYEMMEKVYNHRNGDKVGLATRLRCAADSRRRKPINVVVPKSVASRAAGLPASGLVVANGKA